MNFLSKIVQIFKIKDLRNKILFILGAFAVFRIMGNISIPGINAEKMESAFANNDLLGMWNMFSGGSMDKFSIVMMGLGPYITATIILQLLTMIFPALERIYKEEGEAGKKKFNQWGRIATIPLAFLQGYAMLALFQSEGWIVAMSTQTLLISLLTITAGTVFLMWLGELITEKGIGNGVSLLIFAGIVADVPNNILQTFYAWDPAKLPAYILFFGISALIIAAVVVINEGRRNIPVSYAKRVRGGKMFGGSSTYLPLNINPAGVIPIIFAMSLLMFPGMISNFLGGAEGWVGQAATALGNFFENQWIYQGLYFVLIVAFTFFYTAVTFDPKAISTNLQKMGGFIPGIRPGTSTANFMYFILNRVLLIGALFLGIIAILPSIISTITNITTFNFLIGGTALLIVVSVALDIMRQVKSQLEMREYETF